VITRLVKAVTGFWVTIDQLFWFLLLFIPGAFIAAGAVRDF
jgi:hypothetical protein